MKIEHTCIIWTATALGAIAVAGCSGATTATNSPDDTAEYETMPGDENEGIGSSEEPFAPGATESQYGTESQQPDQNQPNQGIDPGMQENPQSPGTQPGTPGSPGSPGTQPLDPDTPGTQGSPGNEGAPDTQGISPGTAPRDPSGVDDQNRAPSGTQPGPQGLNQGSELPDE